MPAVRATFSSKPLPPLVDVVEDSFTGADDLSLQGRTPDVTNREGDTWDYKGWGSAWVIKNNAVGAAGPENHYGSAINHGLVPSAGAGITTDCLVYIDSTATGTGVIALWIRARDPSADRFGGWICRIDVNNLLITPMSAVSWGQAYATDITAVAIDPGWNVLTVLDSGTSMVPYLNTTEFGSFGGETENAETHCGVYQWGAKKDEGILIDNFRVRNGLFVPV